MKRVRNKQVPRLLYGVVRVEFSASCLPQRPPAHRRPPNTLRESLPEKKNTILLHTYRASFFLQNSSFPTTHQPIFNSVLLLILGSSIYSSFTIGIIYNSIFRYARWLSSCNGFHPTPHSMAHANWIDIHFRLLIQFSQFFTNRLTLTSH